MAVSLNRVTLIGHLGNDPDIRHTQDGRKIANLSIATSESWKDKNTGEKKERTEWHRVVIFSEPLSNIAEQYLHKGSRVMIEGSLQTRKWTDQSGVEKYSTEIVLQGFGGKLIMLDGKGSDQTGTYVSGEKVAQPVRGETYDNGQRVASPNDLNDQVPFN